MYAIVDLETTGTSYTTDRILEVAIVLYDGQEVRHRYSTLVNPQRGIPYFISRLTGISDEAVRHAPTFPEVAREIVELTEGAVFVAHNVSFDYNFLRAAYRDLGFRYERPRLCTVKLARRLMPGLQGYGLEKLCTHLQIPMERHHRALSDAEATTRIFSLLLARDSQGLTQQWARRTSPEQNRPPQLAPERIDALPELPGVYYFIDQNGDVLYVGKANNIRQRIHSHFGMELDSPKHGELLARVHDLRWTLTGNELIALLHESAEIKRLLPPFNCAQKRRGNTHGLYRVTNPQGYQQLMIRGYKPPLDAASPPPLRPDGQPIPTLPPPLTIFGSLRQAKQWLERQTAVHNLCARWTGLDKTRSSCFRHQLGQCEGACIGREAPESYNVRVEAAVQYLGLGGVSAAIWGPGAEPGLATLTLVRHGTFLGWGTVPTLPGGGYPLHEPIETLLPQIKPQDDNRDVQQILRGWLLRRATAESVVYYDGTRPPTAIPGADTWNGESDDAIRV
jgi:DNA polymerase-3 subunit epsilon